MKSKNILIFFSSLLILFSTACSEQNNVITTSLTETTSVSFTVCTTPAATEAVTEPPVTEDPEETEKKLAEEQFRGIFSDSVNELSQAYRIYYGYDIESSESECIVCNPYTIDIYYRGHENDINDEVYSDHPGAVKCRILNDSRFGSNNDVFEYLNRYFSYEIIRERAKHIPQFVKTDGHFYYIVPEQEFEFKGFATEGAEITDIVPEESFSAVVYTYTQNDSEEISEKPRYKISFKNTDKGWKTSQITDLENDHTLPEI